MKTALSKPDFIEKSFWMYYCEKNPQTKRRSLEHAHLCMNEKYAIIKTRGTTTYQVKLETFLSWSKKYEWKKRARLEDLHPSPEQQQQQKQRLITERLSFVRKMEENTRNDFLQFRDLFMRMYYKTYEKDELGRVKKDPVTGQPLIKVKMDNSTDVVNMVKSYLSVNEHAKRYETKIYMDQETEDSLDEYLKEEGKQGDVLAKLRLVEQMGFTPNKALLEEVDFHKKRGLLKQAFQDAPKEDQQQIKAEMREMLEMIDEIEKDG